MPDQMHCRETIPSSYQSERGQRECILRVFIVRISVMPVASFFI